MTITEITRTVSGTNYSNLSAKATLNEKDTVESASLKLDKQLKIALNAIERKSEELVNQHRENRKATEMLECALKYAKDNELPF